MTQPAELAMELSELKRICRSTPCLRCFPITALAVSRALELGLHSSGSYGYHFRSSPALERLRIPPASVMPVIDPG